jgi:hypothetical protein
MADSILWVVESPPSEPLGALPELFGPLRRGENKSSSYLKTEVAVLTSDKVLELVVAIALVGNLPMIKMSQDPKRELREKMKVEIEDSDEDPNAGRPSRPRDDGHTGPHGRAVGLGMGELERIRSSRKNTGSSQRVSTDSSAIPVISGPCWRCPAGFSFFGAGSALCGEPGDFCRLSIDPLDQRAP